MLTASKITENNQESREQLETFNFKKMERRGNNGEQKHKETR